MMVSLNPRLSRRRPIEAAAILREKGIGARVLDMATSRPLGREAVLAAAQETGAILTVKALHALERKGQRRAIVTMCIGGGQGIALALERI